MTCSIPGMCSRSPDCHDTHCPGKWDALHRIDAITMARKQGFLRTEDGGHRVHGEDSLRIPAPSESSGASVGFLVVAVSSIAAAAIGVFLCVLKSSCI